MNKAVLYGWMTNSVLGGLGFAIYDGNLILLAWGFGIAWLALAVDWYLRRKWPIQVGDYVSDDDYYGYEGEVVNVSMEGNSCYAAYYVHHCDFLPPGLQPKLCKVNMEFLRKIEPQRGPW